MQKRKSELAYSTATAIHALTARAALCMRQAQHSWTSSIRPHSRLHVSMPREANPMASIMLRPWTHDAPDTSSLKDMLARAQRGHFRDITEVSLQEEIAGEGTFELSESESDDEEEDKDEEISSAKPSTRDDLFKARLEMLRHVDTAHNDVMIALDFVSLLLTHDAPEKGKASISAGLRQEVPIGTLGHDIWHRMPQDKAREAQDKLLATNVRLESLQQSADSLLAAASRLEDNVRKETRYWDHVLSINENGWNVCKLPGQQHRLGVTYGFSDSAPEFARRGVAALNATSDGTMVLERGVGSKPRAVRVLLKRGEVVVGCSRKPALRNDGEVALEARIRRARDSLFDEELYREMLRESRGQASLGISTKGNGIVLKPDSGESPHASEVVFELVSLDEVEDEAGETREQDSLAQAIALAARMLLSQAHREKVKKRSAVPLPMSERKDERQSLPILRPIMASMLHKAAIDQINGYLASIESLLSAASIEHRTQPAAFAFPKDTEGGGVEDLISTLMQCWNSEASIDLHNRQTTMRLETTLANSFGTQYTLSSADRRVTRFSSQDELRAACDDVLASELALHLKRGADGDWECNVREALLVRPDDGQGKGRRVWITLDSEAGVLSLNTPTEKVSWGSQVGVTTGFSDAWVGLVE
ncbi:RNA polymerase II mediator complex subunit [Friedmanniomyces endolithicus]|nr:RNA polymerase II mediator complex subunit [Friedmanniomyces endolithicus]